MAMEAVLDMEKYVGEVEKKPEKSGVALLVDQVVDQVKSGESLEEVKIRLNEESKKVRLAKTQGFIDDQEKELREIIEDSNEKARILELQADKLQRKVQLLRNSGLDTMELEQIEASIREQVRALIENQGKENKNALRSSRKMADLTGETLIDEKTEVATAAGMRESLEILLSEAIETDDFSKLRKIEIQFIDMMLFHRGNQVMGADGFDERVKTVIGGEKAVSRFSSKGNGLYSPFLENEIGVDVDLNKYFPEGSESKVRLERLKELGVSVDVARVNASGGDEFVILRTYEDVGFEAQKIADEVISGVIHSTAISVSREVILKGDSYELTTNEIQERKRIWDAYYETFNRIHVWVDERAGVDEKAARRYHDLADAIRGYFKSSEKTKDAKGFLVPEIETRMDFAVVKRINGKLPILGEIEEMLTSGSLIGSDYLKFIDHLKEKVAARLTLEELKDETIVDKAIKDEFVKEAWVKYFMMLNNEVNGTGKDRKKMNLILEAAKGDFQAMFTVGTVEKSGRNFATFDNYQKKMIMDDLHNYYLHRYMDEIRKMDEKLPYDEDLIKHFQYLYPNEKYIPSLGRREEDRT